MAMDLRLGQFTRNTAQRPQRTGSAGVCVPGVLDVDLLQVPRYSAGLGDAAGAADVDTVVPVLEAATGPRRALAPRASRNSVRSLKATRVHPGVSHRGSRWPLAVEPAPARNLGTCNMGRFCSGCAVRLQ